MEHRESHFLNNISDKIKTRFRKDIAISGTVMGFLPDDNDGDNYAHLIIKRDDSDLIRVDLPKNGGFIYKTGDGLVRRSVNYLPFSQGDVIGDIKVNKDRVKPWIDGSRT